MADVLTLLLVIITAFYAWATYHVLKANQSVVALMSAQTEALTRPYVVAAISLQPDIPLFTLRISNIGKTPAEDLRLSLDHDFKKFGRDDPNHSFSNYAVFKEKIDSFPPGAEIYFDLAQGFVVFGKNAREDLTPKKFTITAEYRFGGRTVRENNIIDFRPYYLSSLPNDPHYDQLKKIAESITTAGAKIERELDKLRATEE